ncbi:N-acetyltransferase [Virgibacillus phasianinus]|uniref:N-acetyltransferase n=1 Tax=Virgibacillus phasianinus TaxID=2017483 RepID=A0A220TZ53_9BACI|nr:GNAT family N-acetyltransferase [Virgibacillus phasianinus]ASK61059.1 N-acetyltransferase [Virgibacillus phasianinus]
MLKKRDLFEAPALFDLLKHKEVYPYVRHKAETSDEFYFITKQTVEAEEKGELISRTILDEFQHPIGTINLYDIQDQHGFLATWIGQPYFGKGYNKRAKELFFEELFFQHDIKGIFMKIRKTNIRSLKAILKIPYVSLGNTVYPEVYQAINQENDVYELFVISKEHYLSYHQFLTPSETEGGEEVS